MKRWPREEAVPTNRRRLRRQPAAWFEAFLADRGTRKPSAHTMKAYRQDFDAIATLIVGDQEPVAGMPLSAISTDQLRTGFAGYAETHEAASIRRCWSTWNVLCTYLFTAELIPTNPMRRHAELRWTNGAVQVVDIGSLNGSYLNGQAVESSLLVHGDELQFGKFRLTFVAASASESVEAAHRVGSTRSRA